MHLPQICTATPFASNLYRFGAVCDCAGVVNFVKRCYNTTMITIYKTKTMADAADYVMDVLSRVDKARLDVTHTVIVPDRASLEAERALLKKLGGSFNVQVKTFRRLAADVLPKYDYLSKQAGIMALSGIIADNKSSMTCFTKGVDTPGFVENIYDTISMMKYCRISPQMLNRNLPKSVSAKAHDIALLYSAYLDYTADRFIDSADKLELLCQAISDTDFAAKSYFYLYDFDNFSVQELNLVEQLMLKSLGVTVACCASDKRADGRLYLNDICNGVLALCRRNGIQPNILQGERYRTPFARQIGDGLYRYNETAPVESGNFAEIFEGASRADEVYALACKIRQYVRGGRRFGDVYVVTSDINKYVNAISTIFDQFDIPYFCDRQYTLSEHPYARFVLDYLTLCRNNGKLSSVLPFVKNYLFCGDLDGDGQAENDVFLFENHCLKYNVSYRYDRFDLGLTEPYFDRANSFRERFNRLYCTLKAPNCATVQQYVDFVRRLLELANLPNRCDKLAKRQAQEGFAAESKVSEQAPQKFESVLLQAERVMGQRTVKTDEFIRLLQTGLSSVKISVIPVFGDCVIFANMAKARKHDVKFLALLGANQGAMPIVKSDTKLLSDSNIRELCAGGVNVEPLIATENRRERFSLFQLLMEPTDKLYVSYALADGADSLAASPFVKELGRLFTRCGAPLVPATELDEDIYTAKQALGKLVLNERRLKDNQIVNVPSFAALQTLFGKELRDLDVFREGSVRVPRGTELYLKGSATSVSQLTDFFKCPYRFYIQYGLNVKPRTVAELQSSDLGNILHAVLETYVRDMDLAETDEQTEVKAQAHFDAALADDFYCGLKNDVKMAGILMQLRAESVRMCKVAKHQLQNSDFVNYATELSFGDGKLAPVTVQFDGGQFNLVGKIDRVDVFGDRFVVIDYKSGANAAHYGEKELYVGHKLQLPVYVKAVKDLTGKRPAGFYYFNMHDSFADVGAEEGYVYNGRTLEDVDIATHLDRSLSSGRSAKLGLSLKKDGTFNMTSGRTRLLSDEQIENQLQYAFALIKQAGNLMKEGYAAVNPYNGACDMCDYKDVCDFGDTITHNARKVTDSVDKNTIDRTVQNERKV